MKQLKEWFLYDFLGFEDAEMKFRRIERIVTRQFEERMTTMANPTWSYVVFQ